MYRQNFYILPMDNPKDESDTGRKTPLVESERRVSFPKTTKRTICVGEIGMVPFRLVLTVDWLQLRESWREDH